MLTATAEHTIKTRANLGSITVAITFLIDGDFRCRTQPRKPPHYFTFCEWLDEIEAGRKRRYPDARAVFAQIDYELAEKPIIQHRPSILRRIADMLARGLEWVDGIFEGTD